MSLGSHSGWVVITSSICLGRVSDSSPFSLRTLLTVHRHNRWSSTEVLVVHSWRTDTCQQVCLLVIDEDWTYQDCCHTPIIPPEALHYEATGVNAKKNGDSWSNEESRNNSIAGSLKVNHFEDVEWFWEMKMKIEWGSMIVRGCRGQCRRRTYELPVALQDPSPRRKVQMPSL